MAKKSRRARQASAPVSPVRIARPASSRGLAKEAHDVDFRTEYHYVVEDLKRIGILALALLALLIVLAFVFA